MAETIKENFGISPELVPGSKGIYDIIVDQKIIFSKHQAKRFPDNDEIIELIKR
ncbi:MAG: Rdx family protein [Proteobacteria bacterium]|nr:Rdx family protein [Pseudomonadota bacterium]MBU1581127.1 Rdx family protein [Pseudomonadota bacterium]MBU2453988.1 Rdx family protein [Pseudomonadota bacterium]MBU2629999.1 Rdx family protein [Pseudomonadota bacterium]